MASLRNEKSLCESCKLRKVCEGKNDSDEAKVVRCKQWEKENGSKNNKRPGANK